MNNNIHLSIIIPAYNEQERLPLTLSKIHSYCNSRAYNYEVIVVDDGSTDDTIKVAIDNPLNKTGRLHILKNHHNRGKGHSVKRGIIVSKGEYVLFTDADLSTPIEEVEKLFSALNKEYDIAISSRSIKGARIKEHQPFYRECMGKFFNKLVQVFVLKGIIDTQCGFKLFKGKAAKDIAARMRIDGFAFDVEMLYLAKLSGYNVKEAPVVWLNSLSSRVDPIKDSLKMFFDILSIKKITNKNYKL